MKKGIKGNFISEESFLAVMDWQLRKRPTDPGAIFSLTLIDFDGQEVGNQYGGKVASEVLNKFGIHVSNCLRETDIVFRKYGSFQILTPTHDLEGLVHRLQNVINQGTEEHLDFVDCAIRGYIFPCEKAKGLEAIQLMADLKCNVPTMEPTLHFSNLRQAPARHVQSAGKRKKKAPRTKSCWRCLEETA